MLRTSLHIAAGTLTLLRRIAFATGLLLVLLLAMVILGLRYYVLPDIEYFHNDIAVAASKAVGHPVEIGRIEADWYGLNPHLRLSGIRILDEQNQTALALQQVDVVVSLKTLLGGELRLASLEIDRPDLQIRRDVDGVLQISGIKMDEQGSDNDFANMLLKQSRIVIRDARISWQDEMNAKPLLVLNEVNLLLENGWRSHRFAVRGTPPAALATQLDVRGNFHGSSLDDLQDWSGEIYSQLEYADLAAWKQWLPLPDALSRGEGALRVWVGVEKGSIARVTADMALMNVQTRLGSDLPPLDIRVLSGRMGWRAAEQGFEVSMRKFSLRLFDGFVLKPTDLTFRLNNWQEDAASSGEAYANQLELGGLAKMMEYLPLDRKYKDQVAEFSPQGRVENMQAQWQSDEGSQLRFRVKGKFDGLSLQRVGRLPGFSGLSGELDGNENRGTLAINSRELKVDAPEFMPEPLAFDKLTAQAVWKKNAGEYEIDLLKAVVSNEDVAGTGYGSYQTLRDSPGKLDLTVHLTRASVAHAGRYIPLLALEGDAKKWLNEALLAGQSNDFNLRIKGDLNHFPFVDNRNGIFKIHARANGVVVEYDPEWPLVENGNADLLIQGKELLVTTSSATTAGARLKNVTVAMPDLLSNDLMLHIRGVAEIENSRALDFIQSSPVRGYIDGFTDDIDAQGKGKLDLTLDIPLLGEQKVKVAGIYHFTDSEADFGNNLPLLRKVNGDLMFSESGVSAPNITMQILGGPARLQIDSLEGGAMNVRLGGRANFSALSQLDPHPLLQKLGGEAPWKVEIGVQNKLSRVLLTATLKGVKSDLPPPFAKSADEDTRLRFEMNETSAARQALTLQYGTLLNANLLTVKNAEGARSVERGIINFGNVLQKADSPGLWVIGTLPELSLEGMVDMAGMLPSNGGSAAPSLAGTDLQVQKLTAYGNNINNLHIKASTHNGMLSAKLASAELNGELSWQGGSGQAGDYGRLLARIKNLDLSNYKPDASDTSDSSKKAQPAIKLASKADATTTLPALDLNIDKLSLKGRQLGKLELLALHRNGDYAVDHLRLSSPDGVLNLDGKWSVAPDAAESKFNVKLDIKNAGNMLARFGYPDSVKNGKGRMEGSFAWPGTPKMYNKQNLNGSLSLDAAQGQFLQIDPGAGKLLSILSLQALPKRITLDFDDVFSKGFEFDKITGSAQIRQGVMNTDNLKIEGSSAKVSMAGQIDLPRETQNMRVRIVPTVGNSVALLSALAANPVIGAGVYLAGKLLNDPLGQLVSFEYGITGGWADPKVEKIAKAKKPESPAN